jgi:flagellar basal body-associated protein FliL
MATDLSQTIQEGIAQTLTELLGIDTKFQETTKVDRRDIQTSQLLEVNSEFEFEKLTTEFQFIIPSNTASIIFNTMMGTPDYEIATEIDDDTVDAMGEFISNVSGSLVTAFNAQDSEDLGNAKFHIKNKETIEGSSFENLDNLFRFVIEIDDNPTILFIHFQEEFLPFIESISNSKSTEYPEEQEASLEEEDSETKEESEKSEPILDNEADSNEPIKEKESEQKEENIEGEDEENQEELKKKKKMKIIIIALSSLIIIVLTIFAILYFTSDNEEEILEKTEQTQDQNATDTNEENKEITTTTKTLKKIDFNLEDIDIVRLNGRLSTLTKYNVLTKEELETQKKEESLLLEKLEKEKELLEFAKLNKEEPLVIRQEDNTPTKQEAQYTEDIQKETKMEEMEEKTIDETPQTIEIPQKEQAPINQDLLYLSSNNIKYTLFRSLISQLNSKSARLEMCNDTEGRTTIYIGPFISKDEQNQMVSLIKNSNEDISIDLHQLSKDTFEKRCNL